MDRWGDDRLDDRFGEIERRLVRLEELTRSMAEVPAKIAALTDDTHACVTGLDRLEHAIRERNEQRAEERIQTLQRREEEAKAAADEKKKDRRWIVGTMIAASAVIVTSMGILVSYLT